MRRSAILTLALAALGCGGHPEGRNARELVDLNNGRISSATEVVGMDPQAERIRKSEQEWRKDLSPEAYRVLRENGTERAFTGRYWNTFEAGVYLCAACGNPLFASDAKFASSCGWPSFFQALGEASLVYQEDGSHGMVRVEIRCARCDGHLGHVFDDGPPPTGKRYCLNSVAMRLVEEVELGAGQ